MKNNFCFELLVCCFCFGFCFCPSFCPPLPRPFPCFIYLFGGRAAGAAAQLGRVGPSRQTVRFEPFRLLLLFWFLFLSELLPTLAPPTPMFPLPFRWAGGGVTILRHNCRGLQFCVPSLPRASIFFGGGRRASQLRHNCVTFASHLRHNCVTIASQLLKVQ